MNTYGRGRTTTPARLGVTDEFLRELWLAHFGLNATGDRVTKLLEEVMEMSVFERRTGESLTDWTLRWMSGAPHLQGRNAQEKQREDERLDRAYQREQENRANNYVVSDPPSKEELE